MSDKMTVAARISALEQHVSDLEKSLEAARKGRDEVVSHLADVTEALVGERPVGIMPGTTLDAAMVLVRDRDAALADNVALLETIGEISTRCETKGLRPTAASQQVLDVQRAVIERVWQVARDAAAKLHPGASLLDDVARLRIQAAMGGKEWLELQRALGFPDDGMVRSVLDVRDAVVGLTGRHGKALVRARNEGLEKAASRCEESDAPIPISEMAAGGRRTGAAVAGRLAKQIRALKEPEQ